MGRKRQKPPADPGWMVAEDGRKLMNDSLPGGYSKKAFDLLIYSQKIRRSYKGIYLYVLEADVRKEIEFRLTARVERPVSLAELGLEVA